MPVLDKLGIDANDLSCRYSPQVADSLASQLQSPVPHKLGTMVVQAYHPGNWKVEARASRVLSPLQLHENFRISLGYTRLCQNEQKDTRILANEVTPFDPFHFSWLERPVWREALKAKGIIGWWVLLETCTVLLKWDSRKLCVLHMAWLPLC